MIPDQFFGSGIALDPASTGAWIRIHIPNDYPDQKEYKKELKKGAQSHMTNNLVFIGNPLVTRVTFFAKFC
jgi:hypothetical protein